MGNAVAPDTAPTQDYRISPRNKYLGIIGATLQQVLAYRVMAISSIVANMFWIVILHYVWRAAFAGHDQIEGFTWNQMQTYILLAYGINAMIGFASASRMISTIRQGDVVIDMIRPINYMHSQLSFAIGLAILEGAVSFTLTIGAGILFLDMQLPASAGYGLLFLVSLPIGFLTKFLFVFSFSLLVFWVTNSNGMNGLQIAIVNILAGVLIPIQFLPGWLVTIAEWSPLRGIVSTPAIIYLGQYEGSRLAVVFGAQVLWLILLWMFAGWAWPRAFRAVEIQGG
jgi:ABC-2 type transport system permease protein